MTKLMAMQGQAAPAGADAADLQQKLRDLTLD
jgi:hypothetical protein